MNDGGSPDDAGWAEAWGQYQLEGKGQHAETETLENLVTEMLFSPLRNMPSTMPAAWRTSQRDIRPQQAGGQVSVRSEPQGKPPIGTEQKSRRQDNSGTASAARLNARVRRTQRPSPRAKASVKAGHSGTRATDRTACPIVKILLAIASSAARRAEQANGHQIVR